MNPGRADIVAMLASFGDRSPDVVPETIGSMELAWLVHQLEQRYGAALRLEDADIMRMTTVMAAVEVIRDVLDRAPADPGRSP